MLEQAGSLISFNPKPKAWPFFKCLIKSRLYSAADWNRSYLRRTDRHVVKQIMRYYTPTDIYLLQKLVRRR